MPECGIGLIPDVGGSYILASTPGYLGEYLGLTAARITAADVIICRLCRSLHSTKSLENLDRDFRKNEKYCAYRQRSSAGAEQRFKSHSNADRPVLLE